MSGHTKLDKQRPFTSLLQRHIGSESWRCHQRRNFLLLFHPQFPRLHGEDGDGLYRCENRRRHPILRVLPGERQQQAHNKDRLLILLLSLSSPNGIKERGCAWKPAGPTPHLSSLPGGPTTLSPHRAQVADLLNLLGPLHQFVPLGDCSSVATHRKPGVRGSNSPPQNQLPGPQATAEVTSGAPP